VKLKAEFFLNYLSRRLCPSGELEFIWFFFADFFWWQCRYWYFDCAQHSSWRCVWVPVGLRVFYVTTLAEKTMLAAVPG